jgi:hypothetical protein
MTEIDQALDVLSSGYEPKIRRHLVLGEYKQKGMVGLKSNRPMTGGDL